MHTQVHWISGIENVTTRSFIFSKFNYCPLVWHFCSATLLQKIEKMQERALRLLYNDSYSSYNILLLKAEWPTMEVSRLQRSAIEVFKTLKFFKFRHSNFHTYFKNDSHLLEEKIT